MKEYLRLLVLGASLTCLILVVDWLGIWTGKQHLLGIAWKTSIPIFLAGSFALRLRSRDLSAQATVKAGVALIVLTVVYAYISLVLSVNVHQLLGGSM